VVYAVACGADGGRDLQEIDRAFEVVESDR
jgi:hypothetical protein